jgi:tripartite-type tricarboxylate transporter receptor subunit TctC
MKSQFAVAVLSMLAYTACAHAAQKSAPDRSVESYPTKPIRVIVPQAPGGSNDIMARYVGAQLGERLGRQVVVDNRPGAEGMIGTETVARANPDGYTLLMASTAFTMNPAVIKKLPYDPIKDFDWVAMLGKAPVVITIGPAAPVNTLQEFIALAKSSSRPCSVATPASKGRSRSTKAALPH